MNITSYAQNFEDVMLWRALGHIERGLYIDVGAQDPVIDSVSLAFHEHGWQGIHVEPTPHYAALLRQKRPGDTVIQAAVGSDSAVLHFFEIPDTGISTADAAIAAQHRARGFDVHETNVPCIPLSAVFQLCAEQEIHWLKIDVEGFEQQVLSSWGTSTARPWIVVVESTLPLTQIDTHQSWEFILVGYGYTSVYFDGLNRYYVSEAHAELKAAFAAPPNVFDGFALNGTASAPFHQLIAARCQEKISEAEKQLAALVLSHSEQERTMQEHQAEQEQALQQKLQALQAQLDRLQQERAASEKLLHAQNSQSRQELERLLRQLVQREQEVAAQLLQAQQQAEREKTELAHRHTEHATALQQQYAEREQSLQQKLQALQTQLDRLQQERAASETLLHEQNSQSRQELERLLRQLVQREQEVAAQLLQAQQQAEREKTELAHRHAEHATALQQQCAEREQVLQQKLQALQAQLDRLQQERAASETLLHAQNSQSRQELESVLRQLHSLEREWAQNEKALSHEIAALQRDVQALHHARQLLAQQHDAELKTKLGEHQRVLAACAALESELKAQVLLEQQASLQLRQSLAEVQHQLGMVHTSFSWRLTAPLRMLAAFIAPERASAAVSPCTDDPNTPAQKAGAIQQPINLPITSCLEPEIASATAAAHLRPSDFEMLPDTPAKPVVAASSINALSMTTESSFIPSSAPVNMSLTPALVAAATLDELLAQHDQSFIQCAYLTLLGREPDPEGLNYYLSRLRTGYSKIQILAQLSLSNEGKAYAPKFSGLDVAIARYQKSKSPLLGWLYRWINGLEGNHPNERKLRSIENQLFAFSHESKCRFNQLETAIASLHHLVAQEAQVITAEVTGEDLIASGKSKTISVQPPEPEGLKQLSSRAKDIYFQLKKAAAMHAGEVA
ncbi:FkbM family methyltransferase [Comamonas aquatica]|uniref:FkbM family methyltransferase n=1 Tax=Comamonas aquatica TaxID=225991 RepID=UPI001B371777|nr:FkbM family methyltransferase [Comamonas aquatica]QTX22072.1 FkbM family methyltransferase [Comamonas aquatica]